MTMSLSNAFRALICAPLLITTLIFVTPTFAREYVPGNKFAHDLPGGGKGPTMVVVSEGTYVMGGGHIGDDPEKLVIQIEHPFAISTTEITTGLYRQFLKATKSGDLASLKGIADELPISGISWDEAEAFVGWLSHQTGHNYTLPSSAQWEYAARAGSTKTYSWGDDAGSGNANCMDCGVAFDGEPAPVASFKPNDWGLYDVHGNVWEWTRDCLEANSKPPQNGMPQLLGNCDIRGLRGGSAESDSWAIRFNARASSMRQTGNSDSGMRVVMQVPR